MNEVFELIFDMFGNVIGWLKAIPITENVSLFDFSVAILVMSIVIVAFVPIVSVGSTNYVNETLKAERAQQERELAEQRQAQRELSSREYGLLSRRGKESVLTFMEQDYKDKYGGRE